MSRGGDFWSRRRDAVAAEAEAEVLADEQLTRETLEAEKTDEELLEELGLPDPDGLKAGDDFSAFMGKMVPDRLRRRALRVLWRSNPTLANLDALVDYGEDFTDSAMVVENLQTTYLVGKGMLTHVLKMAEEAEAKEAADALGEEELVAEVEEIDEEPVEVVADPEVAEPAVVEDDLEEDDFEIAALPPRRMRFAFDDEMRESA